MTADTAAAAATQAPPAPADGWLYDAFFSYASDPDRLLVRAVESFLEGLHENPLLEARYRREMEICVDGSDFKKPRRVSQPDAGEEESDPIFTLITQYMARSRSLVVFVGPQSKSNRWLTAEVRWWLAHRDSHDLHFVLSHGSDDTPAAWMPQEALAARLERVVWFDFRGAPKASPGSASNRIFEEERLRLAAALHADDIAAGDLIKSWRVLSEAARRRSHWRRFGLSLVVGCLAVALGYAVRESIRQSKEAKVGLWTTLASAGSTQDPDRLLDAMAYGAAALHTSPRPEAFRSTVESLQVLARPLRSAVIDSNGHAIDAVVYVDDDRSLVTAGFDKTLRLLAHDDFKVLAEATLQGRAVSITDLTEQRLLIVTTRTGVDLFQYALGPSPTLELVGRAQVAPVRVNESINSGHTLASAVNLEKGVLLLSATSGRVEWYRLAEKQPVGWRPYHSVVLSDTQELPLGIFGMAYVPQSARLVVADVSGEVFCLDGRTGKAVAKPFKHTSDIFAMAVHQATGQVVAADARGGWLSIDPVTCLPRQTLAPPTPFGSVANTARGTPKGGPQVDAARTSAVFSPDGALLSIGGHDGTARVVASGSAAYVAIAPHTAMTRSSAFSRSKRELAVAAADGSLHLWRIDGGAERARMADVEDVAPSTDGRHALVIGHGQLAEIDLVGGTVQAMSESDEFKGQVHVAAAYAPDHYAAWRTDSGYWWLVQVTEQDGKRRLVTRRMDAGIDQRSRVRAIQHLADGRLLLTATGDQKYVALLERDGVVVKRWGVSGEPLPAAWAGGIVVMADQSGAIVAVHSDGTEHGRMSLDAGSIALAVGRESFVVAGKLRGKAHAQVCDLQPQLACSALTLTSPLHGIAMATDGTAIALATRGQDMRPDSGQMWIARRSGGWRMQLLSGAGRVDSLLFSEDGQTLVIGERRGLSLWRVSDSTQILSLPTPSAVRRLAMSDLPTGRIVLSVDGLSPEVLRVWDTDPAAFVRKACERWPQGRAAPQRPGVPALPSREDICASTAPG